MLQDKSLRTSSARRANFGFRAIVSGNDLRVKERRSCTRHSSRNLVSVNYHIIDDTTVSVLGLFQSRIIVTKLWYNGDTIVSVAKLKQCEVAILRLPSDNQLPSVSPARGPTSVNVSEWLTWIETISWIFLRLFFVSSMVIASLTSFPSSVAAS